MTTAHRPTFDPARGGSGRTEGDLSKLSQQYSSKDMPSHTTLKYRQKGQQNADDVRVRDFRRELEDKEREHQKEKEAKERRERNAGNDDYAASSAKRLKIEAAPAASSSADDDEPWDNPDSDDSDEDSDEDDNALLMAELARIRKERAAEKAEKEAQEKEEQEKVRYENILQGNPLLAANNESGPSEFKVKRRWDDDVVFKNCAKGLDERKKEPTFINDAIRSEFHKKFMDKYIK